MSHPFFLTVKNKLFEQAGNISTGFRKLYAIRYLATKYFNQIGYFHLLKGSFQKSY